MGTFLLIDTKLKNHFIKLIVLNKTDDEKFDKFVERLYNEITAHDLNIIEDYSDIKASVRDDVIEMGEDTVTFLNNYVILVYKLF